jgi:hypothetical protein
VKQKTFMLIAGVLAAEQRAPVAHSVSYGSGRPQIPQAPAGATENQDSTTNSFRPIRGLNRSANTFPRFYRGLLSHATPWLKQNPPGN